MNSPEVPLAIVIDSHASIFLVRFEHSFELHARRDIIRMIPCRRVRRREKSAPQVCEIEKLFVCEDTRRALITQELLDLRIGFLKAHLSVVRPVTLE